MRICVEIRRHNVRKARIDLGTHFHRVTQRTDGPQGAGLPPPPGPTKREGPGGHTNGVPREDRRFRGHAVWQFARRGVHTGTPYASRGWSPLLPCPLRPFHSDYCPISVMNLFYECGRCHSPSGLMQPLSPLRLQYQHHDKLQQNPRTCSWLQAFAVLLRYGSDGGIPASLAGLCIPRPPPPESPTMPRLSGISQAVRPRGIGNFAIPGLTTPSTHTPCKSLAIAVPPGPWRQWAVLQRDRVFISQCPQLWNPMHLYSPWRML